MIKTFANKQTAAVFVGRKVRKYSNHLQDKAEEKLKQLDLAQEIDDMRHPPGNRLERLSGNLNGKYSIRSTNNGDSVLNGGMVMRMKLKSETIIEVKKYDYQN